MFWNVIPETFSYCLIQCFNKKVCAQFCACAQKTMHTYFAQNVFCFRKILFLDDKMKKTMNTIQFHQTIAANLSLCAFSTKVAINSIRVKTTLAPNHVHCQNI